jgi:5-(carboxyamino)imidazole ribonucleotide synthase
MLLFDTRKFDIQTHVLTHAESSVYFRDSMRFDDLIIIFKKVDVLTFEIEPVNLEALVKLKRRLKVSLPKH